MLTEVVSSGVVEALSNGVVEALSSGKAGGESRPESLGWWYAPTVGPETL